MNFIYIHTHDSGRFFKPYGANIDTPEIQLFSERSLVFRNAFSTAPTCSPSRSSLLTGKSPHVNGMLGLAHRGFSLNDYQDHIVNKLNEAGYYTALSGIQHVADSSERIGYKQILDNWKFEMSHEFDFDTIAYDISNAKAAASFIQSRGKNDCPFFISLGLFNSHRIFPKSNEEINPDYLSCPYPLFDDSKVREDYARFITSIKTVDHAVGIVLKALQSSDFADNTCVIFTTDHGAPFPEMKCTLSDEGIGIALIIDFPGNAKRGVSSDTLVSNLDVFPTICELAGIDVPEDIEGVSLVDYMSGNSQHPRKEVFSEVTYHAAYEPMRSVRTDRYKYVRRFDSHLKKIPSNIDDCPSKNILIDNGYLKIMNSEEQLFDLTIDPAERNNLANNHDFYQIKLEMRNKLNTWMIETDDPLLKGFVPLPNGGVANKQSCISPNDNNFYYG